MFGRGGLEPRNAVGKAGVGEILPADIVKFFGAVGSAHAVDLDDDEAPLGKFLRSGCGAEGLRHERALRAGIDALR